MTSLPYNRNTTVDPYHGGNQEMFQILQKKRLNDSMTQMRIAAPYIAHKAQAGQFIILRVNEYGERIPLTIADYDREAEQSILFFRRLAKQPCCSIR